MPIYYSTSAIGRRGIRFFSRIGGTALLLFRAMKAVAELPRSFRLFVHQLYYLGVNSLPLILVISIFVGAVAAWQAAYQFAFIGAPLRYLGQAVGKAVVIELAPVLSAIVFAGRVGAGIAAELGTMKVTEQIDALESMGISPIRYLVMPRILSCLFMVPFLVVFAIFLSIAGAWAVSVIGVNVSSETFLNGFKSSFAIGDFINGLIKASVFGLIIGTVACYEGFNATGGAHGVGQSTTTAVVISSVMILISNFVFAVLLFRV
ncbi:MAG: ABC transporter permease [Candidatus Zixiibacteriota bacterium]|mgnify:CR=1 FL=1